MAVILFDGVCNLCNSSVQFIIQRDPGKVFKFASLQSETGKRYKELFNISASTDSIVLIKDDKVYMESTAALLIASRLKWPWNWFRIFLGIPKPIRDKVYKWIAANRYKWFGRKESCMLPSKEDRDRFI
ncbi:thiol-disulfide oxidoreductase [Bacillus sp. MKU004]|nr:thiol-disulfide oxidoreductase [Bacillus sp. MKU004]QWC21300.1 thiol-disulfide oxidoreductase DCC family protein [Bacillus haikouensis]